MVEKDKITFKEKWCYGCDELKPLIPKYWAWADKEHTKFRNKCKKCTNFDSKISHRIHRKSNLPK